MKKVRAFEVERESWNGWCFDRMEVESRKGAKTQWVRERRHLRSADIPSLRTRGEAVKKSNQGEDQECRK
jgi:hypothetical protein